MRTPHPTPLSHTLGGEASLLADYSAENTMDSFPAPAPGGGPTLVDRGSPLLESATSSLTCSPPTARLGQLLVSPPTVTTAAVRQTGQEQPTAPVAELSSGGLQARAHSRPVDFPLLVGDHTGSTGSFLLGRSPLGNRAVECRGPLQLSRLAHVTYPPIAGMSADDGYPAKVTPVVRDPQVVTPQREALDAVVRESQFYGSRGGTLESQQEAERADEKPPAGFADVPLRGGVRQFGARNAYICTAAILLPALVFLLVCCPILYRVSLTRSVLRAALDLSQSFNAGITYLGSEQAYAARMNTLSSLKPLFDESELRSFYIIWGEALTRFQARNREANQFVAQAGAIVKGNEVELKKLLSGMWPWSFLHVSFLTWTRLQTRTNTENTDIMLFYDRIIEQLLLFNGALSLSMSVRVQSDIEEIRALFSTEMASVARITRLYLEEKSDEIPERANLFAIPSTQEEVGFLIKALALMRAAEVTLRFASDPVAARNALGASANDPTIAPALEFVRTDDELFSIGFSAKAERGMMQMLGLTYERLPYHNYSDANAMELLDNTRRLTTLARHYFTDQMEELQKAMLTSERVRQVCLAALIYLSAFGLVYHMYRLLDYIRASRGYEQLNEYSRQLRGSLLRMHDAAIKIAHLRLEDVDAEISLSRRPQLSTITAEERELCLGVSMLQRLEPYLPLPMRYPPPATPASALVNRSVFLKPALLPRGGLVAIRVDFSGGLGDAEYTAGQRRPRSRGGPMLPHQLHRSSDSRPSLVPSQTLAPATDDAAGSPAAAARDDVSPSSSTTSPRHRRHRDSMTSFDGTISILRSTDGGGGGGGGGVGSGSRTESIHRHAARRAGAGLLGGSSALTAAGGTGLAHHAYRTELLRVLGALVNVRPVLDRHHDSSFCVQQPSTAHPGAYMHTSGDVTTVWVNLCEDVPYACLIASYACTALMQYCAGTERPCPELTICVGSGFVGNVSSFRTSPTPGPPRKARRPRYEDLWPDSAFFARAEGNPSAAAQAAAAAVGVPVKTEAAAGVASGRARGGGGGGKTGRLSPAAELDLVLIATAGLSKWARAAWWLRQLLGLRSQSSALARVFGEASSDELGESDRLMGREASGRTTTRAADSGAGLTSVLASAAAAQGGGGGGERVSIPLVLPASYAPSAAAACLTSFIVCGPIAHELETVHALAELHGHPLMANDAAVEQLLREKAAFDRRYDAVYAGLNDDSSAATAQTEGPPITFGGKDHHCSVDVARCVAHLRAFQPAYVPVDMVETGREYVPAREEARAPAPAPAAARGQRQRRLWSRDVVRRSSSRAVPAADDVPADPAHPRDDVPAAAAARAASEAMDLMVESPPVRVTSPMGYAAYTREVLTRTPASLPRNCYGGLARTTAGRAAPGLRAASELRAVYAWAAPSASPLARPADGVTAGVAAWLRVFNAYARLCFTAALVEPSRFPLRADSEREQLLALVADVRDALAACPTESLSAEDAMLIAALMETSAARLRDVTETIADFAVRGPLVGRAEGVGPTAVGAGDESHLFPEMLLSRNAVDMARLYIAANICKGVGRFGDGS